MDSWFGIQDLWNGDLWFCRVPVWPLLAKGPSTKIWGIYGVYIIVIIVLGICSVFGYLDPYELGPQVTLAPQVPK